MNLLTVNMTLDRETGGGSVARTLHLNRALTDLGVRCVIATSHEHVARPPAELRGIDTVVLPTVAGRLRVPVRAFAALDRAVAAADVVLLMNHWTPINALAWRAARRTNTPHVSSPVGALPVTGRSRTVKRIYNALAGRSMVRGAAAHIAVTREETEDFRSYGVDPAAVTVIPNGMPAAGDGDATRFRAKHRIGPEVPLALFLGRLADIKGPDLLVEAFLRGRRQWPEWQLVVAGPDDGLLGRLRQQVSAAGAADTVRLVGFQDEVQKRDAMAAADLLVIPSRREAMSVVVLEAAAAGRAVLLTDRCGVPEVAASGGGWIVEASVPGLEHGLLEATGSRSRLAEMGQAWRRYATRHFSWEAAARLHLELFERAVRARGR